MKFQVNKVKNIRTGVEVYPQSFSVINENDDREYIFSTPEENDWDYVVVKYNWGEEVNESDFAKAFGFHLLKLKRALKSLSSDDKRVCDVFVSAYNTDVRSRKTPVFSQIEELDIVIQEDVKQADEFYKYGFRNDVVELLKSHYNSVKELESADEDELLSIKGIGEKIVNKIKGK